MKKKSSALVTWFCLATAFVLHGQGTFRNLDFELANVSGYLPGGGVPITNALPAWTAYLGDSQADIVPYDTESIGGAGVSLHGPPESLPYVLAGSYSVLLQGSAVFATSAAISQTGQIPVDSMSVVFLASPLSNLELRFAGQGIPLAQIGSAPNYNILGGDVSAFAGQTGELRFTAPPLVGGGVIDNIQFSSQPIPEPGAVALFGVGALFLGWRLHRSSPSKQKAGRQAIVPGS